MRQVKMETQYTKNGIQQKRKMYSCKCLLKKKNLKRSKKCDCILAISQLNPVKLVHDYTGSRLFSFLFLLHSLSPLTLSRFFSGREGNKATLSNEPGGRQQQQQYWVCLCQGLQPHLPPRGHTTPNPSQTETPQD